MIRTAIGCDVGSGKGAHLFDGGSAVEERNPQQLDEYLVLRRSRSDVLIAWDSPLTGPCDPDKPLVRGQDLTQRPIETFFRSGEWKAPKGISVLPYCGCSHWTLSMRVLGLPKVGPYSTGYAELPFRLVSSREQLAKTDERASVVEVHPAVAIWLWYRAANRTPAAWSYKGIKVERIKDEPDAQFRQRAKQVRTQRVLTHWQEVCNNVDGAKELPTPTNDDELDAIVAWLLADRWITGSGVVLLGNQKSGCFLVPKIDALLEAFARFLREIE